ncbi:MAG TPA: ABC transporter permease, partial [Candidatus Limnocylindrales bacterium]|nr:ABC transporter permease [Candidatus Limnocylindrales bacterium]
MTAQVVPLRVARAGVPGRLRRMALGVGGIVVFLIVWQLVASLGLMKTLFISSPVLIVQQVAIDLGGSDLIHNLLVTLEEWWLGLAVAAVLGILIGLAAGWYRPVRRIAEPWLNFLYAVPFLAVVPLFILWFGIGFEFKVFVAFLSAIFVIAMSTMAGVHGTDPRLLAVADTFGASRSRVFRTIVLPGSVPFIMTGLRQGAGHALVGAVAGEFIASNQGLGFGIMLAGQTLNTSEVFIGIVLLAAL